MLAHVEFDPFADASPDDILKAQYLLSVARGIKPKSTVEEAIKDLTYYKLFTNGILRRPPGFVFYKNGDEFVVGMTHATELRGSSTLRLDALATDKDQRRKGYGAEILDGIIQEATRRELGKVSLIVARDNKIAQLLYESRKFEVAEITGNYQEMTLPLA